MYDMLRILKPSLHRLTARKNMVTTQRDEVEQHAAIAIMKALENWDPEKATFSTHVHWQIRAELQALQWHEHPERRKLVLAQPLRFLEMDRPYSSPNGDETFTLADTFEACNAEEDVESSARKHIALHYLERVFSNYVIKQLAICRANTTDQEKIEKKKLGLMRNRWIYICKVIDMEDSDKIAERHAISRERVRQVVSSIDKGVCGQLPQICKKTKEVLEAVKQTAPETIHHDWDGMLIDFYMATGIDTRLLNREAPLPTRPEKVAPAAPVVIIEETVDGTEQRGAQEDQATNVVEIAKRPAFHKIVDGARITVAAGAMLMALSASANAQSRALPPGGTSDQVQTSTVEDQRAPQPKTHTPSGKAEPHFPRQALRPLAAIVTKRPAWGVRMRSYDSLDVLRKAALQERKSWPWLRGLDAAYDGADAVGYKVVFGPLTRDQASGLCHEARRYERPCSVVSFGTAGT